MVYKYQLSVSLNETTADTPKLFMYYEFLKEYKAISTKKDEDTLIISFTSDENLSKKGLAKLLGDIPIISLKKQDKI